MDWDKYSWIGIYRLSKIAYFVATIERISAERLARLFRDNI